MNDKLKVYLDTSAVSYLDQQDSPERMIITQNAWKELCSGKYEVVISAKLLQELKECKADKLELLLDYISLLPDSFYVEHTQEINDISKMLVHQGIIKRNCMDDAIHIAYALYTNCDVLLSWDIKHIANINTNNKIKQLCFLLKYRNILDIYTPEYLISEEE